MRGSAQHCHRPRRRLNSLWMSYVLRALLCMALALMATRMLHDMGLWSTDIFKQKIWLLNESAKRARTESNVDHSALLECVDGLLGEANALFLKNSNTSNIINIGSVSLTTSRVWKASQNWWRRKLALLLPTSISFVPFWNYQPRTKLLDLCSVRCMSKSKGWSNRGPNLPFKGFTAQFLQRLSLSCRNLARAVVQRHCSGPTSLFRTLSAPSNPELRVSTGRR